MVTQKQESESLADKMERLAVGHARSVELLEKAKAFREGVNGFYADPQTVTVQSFLGRWARARKLYCEITGSPLV